MAKKNTISPKTKQKIGRYGEYFEAEMSAMTRHLREFKANKEEFYRRWSAYSDFERVQKLFD